MHRPRRSVDQRASRCRTEAHTAPRWVIVCLGCATDLHKTHSPSPAYGGFRSVVPAQRRRRPGRGLQPRCIRGAEGWISLDRDRVHRRGGRAPDETGWPRPGSAEPAEVRPHRPADVHGEPVASHRQWWLAAFREGGPSQWDWALRRRGPRGQSPADGWWPAVSRRIGFMAARRTSSGSVRPGPARFSCLSELAPGAERSQPSMAPRKRRRATSVRAAASSVVIRSLLWAWDDTAATSG